MNNSISLIFSPKFSFVAYLFMLVACSDVTSPDYFKEHLSGFVQKGPFNNGTQLTINSLDKNLSQTGVVFNTQIYDNMGSFELNNVTFSSTYIECIANGFYFNEVKGQNSSAPITLWAISDITDKDQININILTHLEKDRVKYLVANGLNFSEAKIKALKEVLAIFGISAEIGDSELLDLSKEGNNNAILLAISVILQADRSVADLSELLANIKNDIQEDGIITDDGLIANLQSEAANLNLPVTRSNIENRFKELNIDAIVPDFETYINIFIEESVYGEVTDIDGNKYITKNIGGLWWMTENLKVTRYANGENLIDGTLIEDFTGDDSTKYYFRSPFMPPSINSKPGYGYYYTLAAVMNGNDLSDSSPSGVQGICPEGWHVPSSAEFGILKSYIKVLGYSDIKSASEAIEFNLVLAGIRGYDFGSYAAAGYNWALRNSSGAGEGSIFLRPEHGANCRCVKDY